jgi:dethiobiotin synthetase
MAKQTYFILGTDTGIGKTWVTAELMRAYKMKGLSVLGVKPMASGQSWIDGELINEDVAILREQSTENVPIEWINPFVFSKPIAPHIAAEEEGLRVDVEQLSAALQAALSHEVDLCFLEGCGGVLCPINESQSMLDLNVALNIPIILVVGMRLGCLNHALLSVNAIEQRGLRLVGWIANILDPKMPYLDKNIATLEQQINAKRLFIDEAQLIDV